MIGPLTVPFALTMYFSFLITTGEISEQIRSIYIMSLSIVIIADTTLVYLSALDTTVVQGGNAGFLCGYTGQQSIVWIINTLHYTSMRLPEKHAIEYAGYEILVVMDVDLEMNGTSYQCVAESVRSSVQHLYVLPAGMKQYPSFRQQLLVY